MKTVGRGWQYTVYDKGNGRVLKKYNTWFSAYRAMLKDAFLHLRPPVFNFSRCYTQGRVSARRSLGILLRNSLDKELFGNPKMVGEYDYEQAYAEPLSAYFSRVGPEEGKKMIDRFVAFAALLLSHSLIEKNFNIARNFGLNSRGDIILTDLGEVCDAPEEIRSQIRRRVWAVPDVLSRIPANLRAYFVEKMDVEFDDYRIEKQ